MLRHKALTGELFNLQWETFLDSEGRIADSNAFRKRIFYGGVEHNMRKDVSNYFSLVLIQLTKLHFILFFFLKKLLTDLEIVVGISLF